jgi:hypothetical protein
VAKALQTLENTALHTMKTFGPQGLANTHHIMAKKSHKPSENFSRSHRAEEISGEFNSQAVANTLWAYATMGRKPGERVMGLLEGRAEAISGEFNSRALANTQWSDSFPFVILCLHELAAKLCVMDSS